MARKERLTVSLDPELVAAGERAVAAGRAESLSAWVSRALADRVETERRLEVLQGSILAYEAEFGSISADEIAAQERSDRRAAIVVRGPGRHA